MGFNLVNPPFNNIPPWIQKALSERQRGKTSLLVLPARTNTTWFQSLVGVDGIRIYFLSGKIVFKPYKRPAPFPIMVVLVEPNQRKMSIDSIEMGNLNQIKPLTNQQPTTTTSSQQTQHTRT